VNPADDAGARTENPASRGSEDMHIRIRSTTQTDTSSCQVPAAFLLLPDYFMQSPYTR
jgi:hypothetical protein